jgi:hypothetical protein
MDKYNPDKTKIKNVKIKKYIPYRLHRLHRSHRLYKSNVQNINISKNKKGFYKKKRYQKKNIIIYHRSKISTTQKKDIKNKDNIYNVKSLVQDISNNDNANYDNNINYESDEDLQIDDLENWQEELEKLTINLYGKHFYDNIDQLWDYNITNNYN